MNPPKCNDIEYINFLIASQRYTCLEASKVQPPEGKNPAHDAINRMLLRLEHDTDTLWEEAKAYVTLNKGLLLIDDSTLDKPYATKMDLVGYHWSGKHHKVVKGINLQSLVWSDGDSIIPIDFRVYNKKEDDKDKNDLFKEQIEKAIERKFKVKYICFDSWYSSLDNLKFLRVNNFHWFTRFKSNRLVNPDRKGNVAINSLDIPENGLVVHLMGYGMVRIFRTAERNNDGEFWATSDIEMDELKRLSIAEQTWGIEMYHRGIKQACGVEKCQCRSAKAQKNHILLAIRSFLRLERYNFKTGTSWMNAKFSIVRDAVRTYLQNPYYNEILATA